jgi:hypothetical protein
MKITISERRWLKAERRHLSTSLHQAQIMQLCYVGPEDLKPRPPCMGSPVYSWETFPHMSLVDWEMNGSSFSSPFRQKMSFWSLLLPTPLFTVIHSYNRESCRLRLVSVRMGPTGIFSLCLSLGSGPKRGLIFTVLSCHLKKSWCKYAHLIFDKGTKNIQWKVDILFYKCFW